MKNEGSKTGRFEVEGPPPLWEWSKEKKRYVPINGNTLPCGFNCLICVDIERNVEMHPSMAEDGRDPCSLCPDCSCTPEWTI